MRKPRKGEYTCNCTAYNFPHRFGSGKCHGNHIVREYWETYYGSSGDCEECILLDTTEGYNQCQVINGIEKETECPVFQEFIQLEEINLTGKYWEHLKRDKKNIGIKNTLNNRRIPG